GMVPQLERVAHPFGVTVMSGGGFDSLTDKHKFAAALAGHDRLTLVLHIGDHDPSGVNMFLAFLEDVEAFTRDLGGQATLTPPGAAARRSRYHSAQCHRGACRSAGPQARAASGAAHPPRIEREVHAMRSIVINQLTLKERQRLAAAARKARPAARQRA